MIVAIIAVTLVLAALSVGAVRLRTCRHRFGVPMSGSVCCLRCTRRFPIEETANGEWRIGKVALAADVLSAHHPEVR